MHTTIEYPIGGQKVSEFKIMASGGKLRYKANSAGSSGFTLIEIMVVVAIIGMLVAIALPNFIKYRKAATTRTCIANLTQLDECKHQWAYEFNQGNAAVPTIDDVIPYLRNNSIPRCPASGTYELRELAQTPICTFSDDGHTLELAPE